MDLGYDVVVMVTGIVLVFLILVLLMLIIMLEGKIFDGLNASKKAKAERKAQESVKAAPAVQAAKPAAAPAPAPVQEPAPVVEQGIPGEIVAAIAAAIAAISGGKYTLRAVRRAGADARGSWGRAGVNDVTSPF